MKNEFYYPSSDGINQIHAIEWLPKGEPKAALQMCHGMVEHIERYHDFATFLAGHGYYVVGHDHLGHGKSVTSADKLGFFHEKHGNKYVVEDIHQLKKDTQKKYPNIPYFIMGHSMGSFLVRQYIGLYAAGLAGAIIMGTGDQPDVVLGAGKLMCKMIAKIRGWEYRSKLVDSLAAGGYNKQFASKGESWLSRNHANVEQYKTDPLSGYMFTVNAYYHMFCGMAKMNKQEKSGKLPKELPTYFVAGDKDPVGNCGKAVENVCKRYRDCGMKDVEIKLYPDDRHEILNELDKDQVYKDILDWLDRKFNS